MLVLTRRPGEAIVIADEIRVTILEVKNSRVRIGISAPSDIQVDRSEVYERRAQEQLGILDGTVAVPK